METKLTNVDHASLEELIIDDKDSLRVHQLTLRDKKTPLVPALQRNKPHTQYHLRNLPESHTAGSLSFLPS